MKYTSALAAIALVSSASAIKIENDPLKHIEHSAHRAATKAINKFLDKWEEKETTKEAVEETKKAAEETKEAALKEEEKAIMKKEAEKVEEELEKT